MEGLGSLLPFLYDLETMRGTPEDKSHVLWKAKEQNGGKRLDRPLHNKTLE